MNDPIDTIEHCAFDAWPAEEVEHLDGWRLRAMHGVSRRANSVWTFEATGQASIEERLPRVEAWYVSRNLVPTFQVTDRARPEGLDAALEQRGYVIDAPVSIQVASPADVLAATQATHSTRDGDAVVTRDCTDEWFELSAHRGRFAKVADVYRALLLRIGPGARFALARIEGQPAAVGLGVISSGIGGGLRRSAPRTRGKASGTMGVFSMLTLPWARRRGVAVAVLRALAATALEEGVETLYLQVERSNTAAVPLYSAASFRELYGYHYRVAPHSASARRG
jgi:ribosomal protein S18 acetylase RimI-like enzyme